MRVGAGNELASKQLFRAPHTHTIFLSFTCSAYKARQACKSEAKIMQREHPNCTTFRICFSLYAVVGGAAISLRRRRLDGTWYPRRGLKRAKNGLLSADRSCQGLHTSPVLTLISGVLQRSCTSGKKWPFGLHFAKMFEVLFFFWEGLSLQAKQRSAPPKKPRACLSQAPTKRGVCASLPAALLPVDATHVAAVPSTPAAISAKPPAVARPTGV